jgi:hypothetical protein
MLEGTIVKKVVVEDTVLRRFNCPLELFLCTDGVEFFAAMM